MVNNGAPVLANGDIRKGTTRIESTREMSLSRCGVEWRAETGESENLDRAGRVTNLILPMPYLEKKLRRAGPNNERTYAVQLVSDHAYQFTPEA
jgi:hypothetical protein